MTDEERESIEEFAVSVAVALPGLMLGFESLVKDFKEACCGQDKVESEHREPSA